MKAANRLDDAFQATLHRRQQLNRLRKLTIASPATVDFSSNGYLSLSNHPDIKRNFTALIQSPPPGVAPLGSGGSRLLDGNNAFAETLEADIASFHGAEAGLLFNSGFEANTGLFSCVAKQGDVVVYDEYIHASVHDGLKLSRASTRAFKHNDVESLARVLRSIIAGKDGKTFLEGARNVFVAVEGVYSMDGDVAPLAGIVACVKKHLPRGNGLVIVDEAHSTGIMGPSGRGLVCKLKLQDEIWARVHTFGKAMGCSGAIVLCSSTARSYLVNYARSLIYTTAMGYPALAAIRTTYDFLIGGHADQLLSKLQLLVQTTHHMLSTICSDYKPAPGTLRIDPAVPASPILPLFTTKARDLAAHCQRHGFMLRPIVFPTVPKGTDRVRLCLHAGNTMEEVTGLVRVISDWLALQESALEDIPKDIVPSRL